MALWYIYFGKLHLDILKPKRFCLFSVISTYGGKKPPIFLGIIYQWIGAEILLEPPHRGNEKQWHNLQTRIISAVYTQLHLCSPRKLLKEHCKFKNSFIFINTSFNCWAEVVFITENSQGFLQTVQSRFSYIFSSSWLCSVFLISS